MDARTVPNFHKPRLRPRLPDCGRLGTRTRHPASRPPPAGPPERSFDIAYDKAQEGGRAQLNAAASEGRLRSFVHAYLGMRDTNLPAPVADFVPRTAVINYQTNLPPYPRSTCDA